MLEPALQAIIEDLCHDGCKAVSHYIKDIESGDIAHQRWPRRSIADSIFNRCGAPFHLTTMIRSG